MGETVALPSIQSPLLFCGVPKVVSNACGPISLCRGYVCGYKSARKVHCGKPRSPTSRIVVFPSFACVFIAALPLVMDLGKRSCEESYEVDGPPSFFLFSLQEQR